MRLHLPLALFFAVLSGMSARAVSFLADGVDQAHISQSERFYDSGKGFYWTSGTPLQGAVKLYNTTGSYKAFGLLADRLQGTGTPTAATFAGLTTDASSCGYQVAVNALDYWQSYYGVFYTGAAPLPYGFTYAPAYRETLGGTQSSAVGLLFYDTWKDTANHLAWVADWYLNGVKQADLMKHPDTSDGAYFADYYNGAEPYEIHNAVQTADSLKAGLFSGFALESAANGTLRQTEAGRLVYLGLASNEKELSHAVTCYGFTLKPDGTLESLLIANSDDRRFRLETVYIREENGGICLYTDAARTQRWTYAGNTWRVDNTANLVTPDLLKRLYTVYSAAETPLTWTGKAPQWAADSAPYTTETLPAAATGWDVRTGHGTYHSYYTADRPVVFDDSATRGAVSVSGTVKVPALRLNNSALPYVFTGSGKGAAVNTGALATAGGGRVTFSGVNLGISSPATLSGHTAAFTNGSTLKAGAVTLGAHGTLVLGSGTAAEMSSLTIGNHGTLNVAAGATLTLAGGLTLQKGAELRFNITASTAPVLTLSSGLTLSGQAEITPLGNMAAGRTYTLLRYNGALDTALLHSDFGTLRFADHLLTLTYTPLQALKWAPGNGTWSATQWGSAAVNTAAADVSFTGGSGNVTVSGTVAPHSITQSGGSYRFSGNGAGLDCAGTLTLSAQAAMVLNVPATAKRIMVQDSAELTFTKGFVRPVSYLHTAAGTTVRFSGSGFTYELGDVAALNGTVRIGAGTELLLNTAQDNILNGCFVSDGAGAVLRFDNRRAAGAVTYELTAAQNRFNGSISIGNGSGAPVVLGLHHPNGAAAYHAAAEGTLLLRQSGTFTTPVTGEGTVQVSRDSSVSFGRNALGEGLSLTVNGFADIGSMQSPLNNLRLNTLTVANPAAETADAPAALHLLSANGAKLTFNRAVLNGGTYTFGKRFQEGGKDQLQSIGTLAVGSGGGTLCHLHEGPSAADQVFRTDIGTLTGTGDLTLSGSYIAGLTHFSIGNAIDYSGNLRIVNNLQGGLLSAGCASQVTADLKGGRINGVVSLHGDSDAGNRANGRLMLGIGADTSIGGLESEANAPVYLYGGVAGTFHTEKDGTAVARKAEQTITPSRHTLTMNTTGTHRFRGTVLSELNLLKAGSGTQVFTGDMAAFNGDVTVNGGMLDIQSAIKARNVSQSRGTSLCSAGSVHAAGGLNMAGARLTAAKVSTAAAALSGSNSIRTNALTCTGDCTLTLSTANTAAPVLSLSTLYSGGTLTLGTLTLAYAEGAAADSSYKLLQYTADFGGNPLAGISVRNNGTTLTLDDAALSVITGTAGGKKVYTLMLNGQEDKGRTLTWAGGNGSWSAAGSGSLPNFRNGDTVVFTHAATVSMRGTVEPGAVRAEHAAGTLTLNCTAGALSGNGSLQKKGEGKLVINGANTYTGGTVLNGGITLVQADGALGTGSVTLQRGELHFSANNLKGNTLAAADGTTLNTGTKATAAALELTAQEVQQSAMGISFAAGTTVTGALSTKELGVENGARLLGGSVSFSQTAIVSGGLVTTPLRGTGSLNKVGGGDLKLAGAATYAGDTVVSAGTLTLLNSGSLTGGGVTVNNGAVLRVAGGLNTDVTLNKGSAMQLRKGAEWSPAYGRTLTAHGGTFYGKLNLNSGSTLRIDSLTIKGGLTLQPESAVTMSNGAKLNIKGSLTLNGAQKWTTEGSMSITCTTLSAAAQRSLLEQLGLGKESVTTNKDGSITITQTHLAGQGSLNVLPLAAEAETAAPPAAAEGATALTDALAAGTRAAVLANHAFAESVHNSHTYAPLTADRRAALWLAALGGESRLRGHHARSTASLNGAALGLETAAGTRGTLGLAVGSTTGRISTPAAPKQRTHGTHAALYGQMNAAGNLTLLGTLAYGRTETKADFGNGQTRFNRNGAEADVRALYSCNLTESTAAGLFGGLNYRGAEHARGAGYSAGSLHELRAELGGSCSTTCGGTTLYAEAAAYAAPLRHTPVTATGTARAKARETGPAGVSAKLGIGQRLTEHGTLFLQGQAEAARHEADYSVSAGVQYTF